MGSLAVRRPLFHSEADFQHALAWEYQLNHPADDVRLELHALPELHVDLFVKSKTVSTAVELKYPTRRLALRIRGEEFALREHGAQDITRYDVIRDLMRIERLIDAEVANEGYVVALTNDPGYWVETPRTQTVDRAFRLHQGRRLAGSMSWGTTARAGTMRNREQALRLTGEYMTEWLDYSVVADGAAGWFRHLVFEVRPRSLTTRG